MTPTSIILYVHMNDDVTVIMLWSNPLEVRLYLMTMHLKYIVMNHLYSNNH